MAAAQVLVNIFLIATQNAPFSTRIDMVFPVEPHVALKRYVETFVRTETNHISRFKINMFR
jgi:hypothetical protein